MPEGDTIHRAAATLRPVLEGRELVRVAADPRVVPPMPAGTRVERVEARGKHLLMRFSTGAWLHTHMRMTGSWHVYPTGAPWRQARDGAVVVLGVEGAEAVCFHAPVVEVIADPARHPVLAALGPDLCLPHVDLDEVALRLTHLVRPDHEVGAVLLDQRVASGIGNVYKSEVAFIERVDPFAPAGAVEPAQWRALYDRAHRLLVANLTATARTTAPGPPGSTWVYDRGGRPCRVCDTPIRVHRQGDDARTTSWCPGCQGPGPRARAGPRPARAAAGDRGGTRHSGAPGRPTGPSPAGDHR
jgi:endonuclease VIII